jgi:hypothetical protein
MGDALEQRASDADRERVAATLRSAASDGRLTVDELDERLHAAYEARLRGELEPLTADLEGAAAPHAGFTVRRGEGGTERVWSILGGSTQTGRWRMARRCTAVAVLGGSDIDLSEVELADDVVELTVLSVLGGSDVWVPEGMRVEVSDTGILGGNDVHLDAAEDPGPGAPCVRLRLISVLGGSDVRRGPKRSWRERLSERRERRRRRRLEP